MRIGSTGAMQEYVKVRDIVFGMGACTNSNYANQYQLGGAFSPIASYGLLKEAIAQAELLGARYHVGNILSSDTFYDDNKAANEGWQKMGVLCVEMEAAALYMNAARCGEKCARPVYRLRQSCDRRGDNCAGAPKFFYTDDGNRTEHRSAS